MAGGGPFPRCGQDLATTTSDSYVRRDESSDKFVASEIVCSFESVKFLDIRKVWPEARGTALAQP
jgi:hypothetical protein